MELKLTLFITICGVVVSSNCTFMELKYRHLGNITLSRQSSNCTFMELKFEHNENQ